MSRPLGWEWQEEKKPMTCKEAVKVLRELYESKKRLTPQKEALGVAVRIMETQVRQLDREKQKRMTLDGYEKAHARYLRRKERMNARTQEDATTPSNTVSV